MTSPTHPRFAAPRTSPQIIHPQHWPEDLDYRGKRVVVIGSGATAVSLIPNLADQAAHVTMLQRSPSYIFSSKQKAYLAPALKKLLPPAAAHRAIRLRYATQTAAIVHLTHRFPKLGRKLIRANVAANLPEDYPVDVHFNPTYNPWDQRMCLVPDADLFNGITEGSIEMITDHIDRFDETGVRLTSGRHLDADIIVTATGLQLLGFGGTRLRVNGDEVKPHDRFVFKSHLLEDVPPNLAWSVGYTNASWTLRADMTARSVANLVKYMRENGYTHAIRIWARNRWRRNRCGTSRPAMSNGRPTRCRSRARAGTGRSATTTTATRSTTASARSTTRWCSGGSEGGDACPPDPDRFVGSADRGVTPSGPNGRDLAADDRSSLVRPCLASDAPLILEVGERLRPPRPRPLSPARRQEEFAPPMTYPPGFPIHPSTPFGAIPPQPPQNRRALTLVLGAIVVVLAWCSPPGSSSS